MELVEQNEKRIKVRCKDYEEFKVLCNLLSFIKRRDDFRTRFDSRKSGEIFLQIKGREI